MRPATEVDALLLLATALASKRHPAALVEVVAAVDLIHGYIPVAEKLGGAIRWLSAAGLIVVMDDAFTLTAPALKIMAGLPSKAETVERIAVTSDNLAAYLPRGEHIAVQPTEEQLSAAIQAHKASRKIRGRNLLMPRPKPDRHFKVDGVWRRAPARRSRSGT